MLMKNNDFRYVLLLLTTSLLWGLAFIAQSDASKYIGPFTFMAIRSLLGALTLIPLILFTKTKIKDKNTIVSGIILGIVFTLASVSQQAGVAHTTIAKSGFITTLYIILVPLFEFVIFHNKIGLRNIICVILSTVGLFILFQMKLSFNKGDLLVLLSAVLFSIHMIIINRFSKYDGIALSFIQLLTATVISFFATLLFETPSLPSIVNATPAILYAGIVSSGIAYTLQIIGQKRVDPTVSAICLSMESFFATIFGFLILKQTLSNQEVIGCMLMFASIILSQINND